MPLEFTTVCSLLIPVLNKYKYINESTNESHKSLKEMTEEYDYATAVELQQYGESPEFRALKADYGNIKTFTYKLSCPEVGKYRLIYLHSYYL